MTGHAKHRHTQTGFTLVEMAMVLLIIALLLGGLLPTVSSQIEQQHTNETRKQLDEIQQALIGYAVANGNFPCPAKSASDGSENRNIVTGACNNQKGFIPWSALGVAKLDAWGRIIAYSATLAYTNSVAKFQLGSARNITIRTRDLSPPYNPVNLSNNDDIPVVILSHGKNGYGATLDNGVVLNDPSATNIDEKANLAAAGTSFVSKVPSNNTNISGGEFDDIVTYISANILFNRMVTAGKLP